VNLVPKESFWAVFGPFGAVGACPTAYQMPTSKRPPNARDAASGKSLAKCEKTLISGHFGEHC